MTEFWEENFKDKQEMWGLSPSLSAILTTKFFVENAIKNILIPGIGYGRNAELFIENGISVTGIEISKTAINLAKKHYGSYLKIHHGSAVDMPFDDKSYEGIFCYALIHLLDLEERQKLIQDCFNQLKSGGYMIFTAISKSAPNYKKGKFISEDRYEFHEGVTIYYYDEVSVQNEFREFGIMDVQLVAESQPMFLIKCRKG